jgi:hypothetical protein
MVIRLALGLTRVPLPRLAIGSSGCWPEGALEDALKGLEADEITGPGGLVCCSPGE